MSHVFSIEFERQEDMSLFGVGDALALYVVCIYERKECEDEEPHYLGEAYVAILDERDEESDLPMTYCHWYKVDDTGSSSGFNEYELDTLLDVAVHKNRADWNCILLRDYYEDAIAEAKK